MERECENCICTARSSLTMCGQCVDQLNANHAVVRFVKGDSIIKQGTYSTNVIFLRHGMAKTHIKGPVYEQITKIVKGPTYLGLPTTFGNNINQYSITAITNAEVCFIDIDVFRKLLKENEQFSYNILLELCQNELETYKHCANRTQKHARGNLADVLLEFADNFYNSDTFLMPLSQSEISNLIDTSRESVSRLLSEFSKDGILNIKGKQIEITNKKLLTLISQNA